MPPSTRCPTARRSSRCGPRKAIRYLPSRPLRAPLAAPLKHARSPRACSTCATRRAHRIWLTGSAFESAVCSMSRPGANCPQFVSGPPAQAAHSRPISKSSSATSFPRKPHSTHLTRTGALYFGPFRSRASARNFEAQFLDLSKCGAARKTYPLPPRTPAASTAKWACVLRPCQLVVGAAEYATKSRAWWEFLRTDGRSLADAIAHSRDRSAKRCSRGSRAPAQSVSKRWRTF